MITQFGPAGHTHRLSMIGRVRRWSLWSLPQYAIGYFLTVELLTVALASVVIAHAPVTRADLGRFALLVVVGLCYAEASDRVDRFKRFLGNDGIWSDHASVWAFAGVLVLPVAYAVVLVLLIYAQQLLSIYRHQSVRPHRALFITSTMVLATLATSRFLDVLGGGIGSSSLLATIVTVGALVIFPVVNLGVLLGGKALATGTRRISALFPDRETVGFELMTLVLGVFTAGLVVHTPWLTPLVLGVLAALHRGSLVKGLQVAASTDSKTGLLNLPAWQERAEQGLNRTARDNQPVAVIMIDLDHFKRVNDTHGHLAGDRVLREVATTLGVELRGHDLLGRFGGEEFVAFLEGPSAEQATEISERLRHRIASLDITDAPVLTASIGVAHSIRTHQTNLADLLQVADTALYAAKSAGRNRVDITHVAATTMS